MIWLSNARIAALYAVITLHVACAILLPSEFGSSAWWISSFFDSASRWCVPIFVMISGLLLLDPNKTESLSVFYKKRISRILIPLLFWSVIYSFESSIRWYWMAPEKGFSFPPIISNILSGSSNYHLWFLYMLAGLYLFTPFMKKFVAGATDREIASFIAILFVFSLTNSFASKLYPNGANLCLNWFVPFLPYFLCGYFLRTDSFKMPKLIAWCVLVTSIALTSIGAYLVATYRQQDLGYFNDNLSITLVPMALSMVSILRTWNKPIFSEERTKKVAELTFGVYLIHPLVLDSVGGLGYGPHDFTPIVAIPLVTTIVCALSLASIWLIHKTPYLRRTI